MPERRSFGHMSPLLTSVWSRIRKAYAIAYECVDITDRRHIFLLASGIAFNLLLCTIPLVILVLSIVSGVIEEATTKEAVKQLLTSFLPQNTKATGLIASIVTEVGVVFNYGTVTGWIAGIALLWLASTLFSSLRTGLNAIFHIPTPKIFLWYRLKDMFLTIISAILILIVTLLSPLLTITQTLWVDVLPASLSTFASGFVLAAVSLLSTAVVFMVLYRIVPNGRLPRPIVIMSTILAVVLWEVARVLFSWYVNSATNFSAFYGGYVALASFALWLYYSAFVFLLSAELAQFIHAFRTKKPIPLP
jgi:membrane protein